MNKPAVVITLASLALFNTQAQVPSILNYQGRVTVGGTNLTTNAAQFKFALVDSNGTTVYWKNDGTTTSDEPLSAVSVAVAQGLYSTLLGDTSLSNMAAIPGDVFTNANVNLRVWFSAGGTNPFVLLAPDQRLSAAGYALRAAAADNIATTNVEGDFAVSGTLRVGQLIGGSNSTVGEYAYAPVIAGGAGNVIGNTGYASMGGGYQNTNNGWYAVLGGGRQNSVFREGATISGGAENSAGELAFVGGGQRNIAGTNFATVAGGGDNVVTGAFGTIAGGAGNSNSGEYAFVGGGGFNNAFGNYAVIGGGAANAADGYAATVAGGSANTYTGGFGAIGGGYNNSASGEASAIAGGQLQNNHGSYSFIGGGYGNLLTNADRSTIGGGRANTISASNRADGVVIAGGLDNRVEGVDVEASFIGGGSNNSIYAESQFGWHRGGFIGGGGGNAISQPTEGAIVGGYENFVRGSGFIGGGSRNTNTGSAAFIGAGTWNSAAGSYSVIAGGYSNTTIDSANSAVIGGGSGNRVVGQYSTIAGGVDNRTIWNEATIGGGRGNSAGGGATVAGGNSNSANFSGSVGGGYLNEATESWSTVAGGLDNIASASLATVPGGYGARATNRGAFVWSGVTSELGETGPLTESTNASSFTVRAPGGARFITHSNFLTGAILPANATAWAVLSDSNSKIDFQRIRPREILSKVAAMPVTAWHYKHDPKRRYIGPMSQDFHAAFGLGSDDKTISTLDSDGVMYAAIQGLVEELKERDKTIGELKAKLEAVEYRLNTLPPAP